MKNPIDETELDRELAIDPNRLDEEWLMQPVRYNKYARQLAEAERIVRDLEERRKVLDAKLTRRAIDNPDLAGGKSTADAIDAYRRSHSKSIEIKKRISQAKYEESLLRNVVFSFTQRRAALENMVILLRTEYFAGPSTPRDLGDWTPEQIHRTEQKAARSKVRPSVRKKKPSKTRSKKNGDT